jgi:hypothetical protein
MSPSTSRKLFHALWLADVRFYLTGEEHKPYLQKLATKHIGETKRELLRVASLGKDIPKFLDIFFQEVLDE